MTTCGGKKMVKNKKFRMIAAGDIFTDRPKTGDKPLIRGKNH